MQAAEMGVPLKGLWSTITQQSAQLRDYISASDRGTTSPN